MFHEFPGLLTNVLLCLGLLLLLRNLDNRRNLIRLAFAALAILFNWRYLSWRWHATMDPFLSTPESLWQWTFFATELIAITLLSWHLFVMAFKPRKEHAPRFEWEQERLENAPTVDVMIPTYSEGPDLLEPTIRAAKAIDYPNLKVHVLDDGGRDWLRELCAEEGVHYLRREDRKNYKAGNLNHALPLVHGDYLLCLDADFVVRPEILRHTLGYFVDPHIAIVQTPQHFSNPDAIQFNLHGKSAWPEEQRIFTDIMQPARDNWDNAFCYGTNFVIRRAALDRIGGFPTESICEDLFLTYRLKQHGWITRFHHETLSVGQAADTLGEFINQRVRWCSGTLQCLFLKDGPIRSLRLSLLDRLFFLDTSLYYLSSIWYFFMLIAPAIFWWTGYAPFKADNGHLLMMLSPRILVSMVVLYWLSNRKVVPIISEIGRYVGVFQIIRAIFSTLLRPGSRVFRVTQKNLTRERTQINWEIAAPHLALVTLTLAGLARTLCFGMASDSGLNENIGLILALTVFTFWISFLSFLTCIEPPLHAHAADERDISTQGSLWRSLQALLEKMIH